MGFQKPPDCLFLSGAYIGKFKSVAQAGLIPETGVENQRLASGVDQDLDAADFVARGQLLPDDGAHAADTQINALALNHSVSGNSLKFEGNRPLNIDAAKHAGVPEFFMFRFDHQVVGPGKIPVMRNVADGMDDLKPYILLAGAAGR